MPEPQSESQGDLGGVAGGTQTSTTRTTLNPEGTFFYDRQSCYAVEGLGASCPQTSGYGSWSAHYASDGSIFVGTNLSSALMQNICGGGYIRFADPNTTMSPDGSVSRRIQ